MFRASKRVEGAHRDSVWSVDWADDYIVTGSLDGTTKLWTKELKGIATSSEQKMGVTSVVALAGNSSIISCCQDSFIRSYGIPDLTEKVQIDPGLLEAWTISVSPGEDVIASGTQRGGVNLWSVVDFTKVASLETPNKFILSTAFSPTGAKLASGGIDGFVNIFDLETQQTVHNIDVHAMPVRSVKYSIDGKLLFTASDDRRVCVLDTKSGSIINSFSHSGMALCLDVSPDHRHFIVGTSDHTVCLWDLGMQRQEQIFDSQHNDQIWGVSFDATGTKFVSVGDDALLQMYEKAVTTS